MTFRAYYDLAVSPPTYDALGFMLSVEMERVRRGEDQVEIIVVPGPRLGFRADKLPPFTIPERVQMRDGIVAPMGRLLPSCTSCRVERPARVDWDGFGYGSKTYGLKRILAAFAAGVRPLRAEPAEREEPYITITLREATYWPTRNSNLAEWLKVAAWAKSEGLDVVIIRDMAMADEPIEGFETAPDASRDLATRAALYAGAELNLFVNNGPAWLCLAMDAPTLIVKMVAQDVGGASEDFFRSCGLEPGSQIAGAPEYQRVLWSDDVADAVIAAAAPMIS